MFYLSTTIRTKLVKLWFIAPINSISFLIVELRGSSEKSAQIFLFFTVLSVPLTLNSFKIFSFVRRVGFGESFLEIF